MPPAVGAPLTFRCSNLFICGREKPTSLRERWELASGADGLSDAPKRPGPVWLLSLLAIEQHPSHSQDQELPTPSELQSNTMACVLFSLFYTSETPGIEPERHRAARLMPGSVFLAVRLSQNTLPNRPCSRESRRLSPSSCAQVPAGGEGDLLSRQVVRD